LKKRPLGEKVPSIIGVRGEGKSTKGISGKGKEQSLIFTRGFGKGTILSPKNQNISIASRNAQ